MPAPNYTGVVVTIDKSNGQIDMIADSNRLKFFEFIDEDARYKRIVLVTIPIGRMTELLQEKAGWVEHTRLCLREAPAKRPAG